LKGNYRNFKRLTESGILFSRKWEGGHPEYPLDFNLNINGEEINFSAFQKIRQKMKEELKPEEKSYRIEWRVVEIYGPSHLKSDKSKLFPLIEEALDAYGFASSRKNVESVTVTYSPSL
jgi:hypothetical protein